MGVQLDPQDREIKALFAFAGDVSGRRVLEIGCGEGRLTWKYADLTARVVGIDPNVERIKNATESMPEHLKSRVDFLAVGLDEFVSSERFDLAILSWSL